jgi:hypothetical protein
MCQQCVNTGSSPKMEHAQTCPTPDVVAVMTQSSTTSITTRCLAVMTKSSSKELGRSPTIKFITGRSCYRKANNKTVRIYARQKFPGFERGSGYSFQQITIDHRRNEKQTTIPSFHSREKEPPSGKRLNSSERGKLCSFVCPKSIKIMKKCL